jgi:hypothetical protein
MVSSLFSRLNCYFSGHDYSIKQSGGRMFLMCTTCGHRSHGLQLMGRPNVDRPVHTRKAVVVSHLTHPALNENVARQ